MGFGDGILLTLPETQQYAHRWRVRLGSGGGGAGITMYVRDSNMSRGPMAVHERADVFLGWMDDAACGRIAFESKFLRRLHGLLLNGLPDVPSPYRARGIRLRGSTHVPPLAAEVPELMAAMCDHMQTHAWANACEASGYLHWRLTWIHPFSDGNGRTARAASFLLLCATLRSVPPGTLTVMEQFTLERARYCNALRVTDAAWAEGRVDLSGLATLTNSYLECQRNSASDANRELFSCQVNARK